MKSDDSFHALCLSVLLVRDLLAGFLEKGGRILIEEAEGEEELSLDASYLPSGPLSSLTLGNGLTETRAFTNRYFPTSMTVPGRLSWS